MSEIYSRLFSERSNKKNYRLISFIGIDIYLFINKEIVELLKPLTDETRYCQWVFSTTTFSCRQDFVINRQYFDRKIFYFVNMRSSTIITQCDHLNWFTQKRKWIYDSLLSTTSFAKISYPDDYVLIN